MLHAEIRSATQWTLTKDLQLYLIVIHDDTVNFLLKSSLTTIWLHMKMNEQTIQKKILNRERLPSNPFFFFFRFSYLFSRSWCGVFQSLVKLYLNTWCNPTLWQRFLSTESEMLLRRILVEERGRFPLLLLESWRKIDKGSSWTARDFWSASSKSRRRTAVLRSIFFL